MIHAQSESLLKVFRTAWLMLLGAIAAAVRFSGVIAALAALVLSWDETSMWTGVQYKMDGGSHYF